MASRLTSAHTADNLAEKLFECFRKYGIENKVRKCHFTVAIQTEQGRRSSR